MNRGVLVIGSDTWLSPYYWVDGTHLFIEDAFDINSSTRSDGLSMR